MRPQMPAVETQWFEMRGGLNLTTPPLKLPDGMCQDALNFECQLDGGYSRVMGYERFDGQPSPSAAGYSTLPADLDESVEVGVTITGVTSGATAVVIVVTNSYLALTKVVGIFQEGEVITVAGDPVGEVTGQAVAGGAPDQKTNAYYISLAANLYRQDIQRVPGTGSILGVWKASWGKTYAIRNTAGGDQAKMYESSPSGWVEVTLGYEVEFSNANVDLLEGYTLTQGAVTAWVRRVVLESGTLQSGTNTGRLMIHATVGGNLASGSATTDSGGTLTLGGPQSAITLPPGGRYEFLEHNFTGYFGTRRMYGASGVGRAFEYDGTVFVPLSTGMMVDTPSHIYEFKNHLFLGFLSSAQHSGVGNPYSFTAITGAGELAVGDLITGFLELVGNEAAAALAIFTQNSTKILYGTNAQDWHLINYNNEAGANPYTMQNIGQAYVMDEAGIRQLASTQNFGNFDQAQISKIIRPLIAARSTRSVGSMIVRRRNQYRLYFNDRFVIHTTFDNGKIVGMMPIQYAHGMECFSSHETGTGEESLLAGGTDGYVYALDKGTSFDGEPIISFIKMAFNHLKSPRVRKRFRKAVFEVTGGAYAEFEASYELGYATPEVDQGITQTIETVFGSVFWDSFTWDAFYWDGRTLLPAELDLTGTEENIALILRSQSDMFDSITVNSTIMHYTVRRQMR